VSDVQTVRGQSWPREVEDVLYEHPAIREAAVVDDLPKTVTGKILRRELREVQKR